MRALWLLTTFFGLFAVQAPALAQTDEWFVGSHPEYHAAMIRDIDGVFVAIHAKKGDPLMASPVVMETNRPTCSTVRPIELHATEALMVFGSTPSERLVQVRTAVQYFFEKHAEDCPISANFEDRFFHRFDAAYLAIDALLVEAGIYPLDDGPRQGDYGRDAEVENQ